MNCQGCQLESSSYSRRLSCPSSHSTGNVSMYSKEFGRNAETVSNKLVSVRERRFRSTLESVN